MPPNLLLLSNLLGAPSLQLAAMRRADIPRQQRTPLTLYADEPRANRGVNQLRIAARENSPKELG